MKKYLFTILVLLFIQVANALPPSIPGTKPFYTDTSAVLTKGSDSAWFMVNGLSYKKVYNVVHFGAVPDSSADSRAGILAALDAYRNDGDGDGAILYFPPGVYRLSDSIMIPADTLPNLSIAGMWYTPNIYLEGTGGFYVYDTTASGKTGVQFSNLFFYADTTADTVQEFAISYYKTGLVSIHNVRVEGGAYLDKGYHFVGSQQGYVIGGYINKCIEGVVFDSSVDASIYSNGIFVSGLTITGQSSQNEFTRAVRYSGSHTGTLIGNHFTNCSTMVEVNSGYALNIISNHFETSKIGLHITGGSNTTVSGNMFSESAAWDLYISGGNKNVINGGNLFNGQVLFGLGTAKNFFGYNTLSDTLFDSVYIAGDSSNFNTFMPNETQGNGYGPTGIRVTTNTNDPLDFYMYSTAGPFTGRLIGTDSAYLGVSGIGTNVPFGFKFESAGLTVAKIEGNTTTSNGLRVFTNNGSNILTERFRWSGAADSIRAAYSNTSKLILPPIVWVGNASDSALITEPFIDSIRANQFGTPGSAVWGEGTALNDTSTSYVKTDTVVKIRGSNDTTFMTSGDNSVFVLGDAGKTIFDSLIVDTIMYIVSPGGTDTVFITNVFIDSVRNGDFGGSGSADSAIIDFGSNVYKSSSAKAWSLKFGQALQHTTPTDSSGIDTFTVYVDTNAIALIVEDSLNEYLLTSTASSTYEPLLVNEAGLYSALSDVSNFLQSSDSADGVADGVAQFVTSNGVYDYLVAQGYLTSNETITLSGDVSGSGTTSITTTIGTSTVDSTMLNSTEITEYNSDRVGAMVSGNSESGIAVTYQDADNTLDFAVQNVTSSMIFNQTIVGADIDSTSANFIFDDAYKGTSGVPDSILITRRELDDSLDAVRSENAGLFQPIGHGDADSLKGVPIPNTPTTGDDGKGLTYFETGDTLGWVAYPSQAYVDSVGEAADNDTLNVTSLTIAGDFGVTGDIWNSGFANLLNLSEGIIIHPDSQLSLPTFNPTWDAADSAAALDSSFATHPSNLYIPKGFYGYESKKKLMAYTPLYVEEDENPHLCWADAGSDNWEPIVFGIDTLVNPLWTISDFSTSTHLSDPDIFFDFNDDLWMVFRVTYGSDSEVVKVSKFDTTTGGAPQMSTPVTILADGDAKLISPSVIKDTNETFALFVVEPHVTAWLDTSRIVRYVNDGTKIDSTGGWTFKDTVHAVNPPGKKFWHCEIVPRGVDELLGIFLASDSLVGNDGDSAEIFFLTSYDRGATWTYQETENTQPYFTFWDDTTAFDGAFHYRASGYWVDDGSGGYLDFYYGCKGPYWSSRSWYIGHTKVTFSPGAAAITTVALNDTLSNYVSPGDTKNRVITLECSDVVGRRDIPATDSVQLSLRTMYDASTPVLLHDTSYDVGTSPYYDTLRFVWDALPQDLVSVDSIIFTFIETGVSGVADLFVYGQKTASVMADSAYTSDLTSNVTASSWTRQAIYVGNSDFAGGEQLSALMRIFLASNNSLWIGRMYLKCTVQYTY